MLKYMLLGDVILQLMAFYESAYGIIVANEVGSNPISVGRHRCVHFNMSSLKLIAYLVAMVWVYPSNRILATLQPKRYLLGCGWLYGTAD